VKTESADDRPLNIDDSFNYCEPCLKRFQEGVIAQSKSHGTKSNTHNVPPLSKITKYSPKTATSAMIRHLFDQHSISIVAASNAKRSVGGPVQATLSFASGRAGSGVVSASNTLHEDLLMWLAMDTLPFSTIDTPAFHAMFKNQLSKLDLPSSDTLRLTTLPRVYNEVKQTVSAYLKSSQTLCLMFDGWSDKHNARHFMGIRAAIVTEEWSSEIVTLSCKQCGQDGDSIAEHIATELAEFGLTDEVLQSKQLFTTHDGAAVMMKTSRLLHSKYTQHCCSHSLHLLLMNDGISKIPALRDLLVKCKNIVTKLHFKGDVVEQELLQVYSVESVSALLAQVDKASNISTCDTNAPVENDSDEDDDEAEHSDLAHSSATSESHAKTYRRLKQEIVTRWNSALEMINSLLSMKDEVSEALKRTGNYDMLLKTLDWNVLSQLSAFLESFKTLTEVASGYCVGLSVIPLIKAKVIASCETRETDLHEMCALKRRILGRVDARFPINPFILTATLLDPASKNKKYLGMTLEDKRDLLLDAIRSAASGQVVRLTTSSTSATINVQPGTGTSDNTVNEVNAESDHRPKRLRLMDEFEDEDSDGDIVASVVQYLSANEKPTADECADPLLYWKNSKCTVLASLARMYLTANASSVPCESMFSITGLILNSRRSSLAPHTFNRLIFVHDNARLNL
jgi:hypothetical protein